MAKRAGGGVGLIHRGGVVAGMSKARIEVEPELHRALSIQAAKARTSLKAYVDSLLYPSVTGATWAFLGIDPSDKSVIGETTAKTEKPKVSKADLPKPRLSDDPAALEEVARLAAAGHSIRVIAEKTGYAKSTIAENVRRMKAAGELSATVEEGGGESTGG